MKYSGARENDFTALGYHQATMGWGVGMRGRFMSISSIFSIGGYMASSTMFRRLGNNLSFEIGVALGLGRIVASGIKVPILCVNRWCKADERWHKATTRPHPR
jgi:hypothetical protein